MRGAYMLEHQSLINYLNQLLSNQFIMYVKLHRYHWYIKGRNFFRLHEYFEALYHHMSNHFDETAERILMMKGQPLATMSMYLKQGTLDEANADDTEEEIISQLIHDFEQITREIRETGLSLAEQFDDEPTADLLIEQLGFLENEIWMLMSYQEKK